VSKHPTHPFFRWASNLSPNWALRKTTNGKTEFPQTTNQYEAGRWVWARLLAEVGREVKRDCNDRSTTESYEPRTSK